MRRVEAVAGALAAALAASPVQPLCALQARVWTPELRTLITDGGRITALAVGRLEVLAATRDAVLVFDVVAREWRAPLEAPVPRAFAITALGMDPTSGEVWVGTSAGDLVRGLPGFRSWESVAVPAGGPIERIVPWPAESAMFVLAGGEWWRIDWMSSFAEAVTAAGVPGPVRTEAARSTGDHPFLAAARSSLGLDAQFRRWPITDVAPGTEPDEFWIATGGGGLVHFRSRYPGREWFRFGLVSRGAASIARIGDRLWFGGDGRGPENGVAATTNGLATWLQADAVGGAPGGFVAEIASDGRRIWFAAEDGLFRFDPADSRRAWSRLTSADGLPSDRVRSVLHHGGRVWAGTDRGVVAFDTAGNRVAGPFLTGVRAARLAVSGDTLWIASDAGLRVLSLAGPTSPGVPKGLPAAIAAGRILDVVTGAGTWLLAETGLFRFDAAGPHGPVRDAVLQRIGVPVRLAAAGDRLWVAGQGGIAHLDPVSLTWEAFTVPADLPAGPVLDVLPVDDDVWAATPAGAVRLRWR